MSMWPLIVFVESHFGIKIEDTELMSGKFSNAKSVDQIYRKQTFGVNS